MNVSVIISNYRQYHIKEIGISIKFRILSVNSC